MAERWIFLALMVTIANDAGAYYSGRFYGRRKLYEVVSPKKTIEGSLGGIAAGMIVGTCFGVLFLPKAPIARLLLLSLVLTVVGQLGDLMESMLKRISGVKDSSQILPGHGGVLDRLDSLLFVFPMVWFFANWIVIK
jgi:phosphatidate cytidylyltransferase